MGVKELQSIRDIVRDIKMVPRTGLEPASPFRRYHLKVVRLPISPPGHLIKG